ncbi:MAG: DUF721 domain-containing protein [Bacteroidota bacterium]
MDKNNTTSFSNALKQFLKSENLEKTWDEKKLIASWHKIMGKPIASRTSKIRIDQGKMFVYLSSAPLKQELTNNKQRVLDMLEEELGYKLVSDIRFL